MLDERGGVLASATYSVSGDGHRDMLAWASAFGPVSRWGIEGASGLGRHTAIFLVRHGHDVRDVCPTRTNDRSSRRNQGKSDVIDSVMIARETQAHPLTPVAFKRADGDSGPDELSERIALWHKARRSLLKARQHLLNEAEALLVDLPEQVRALLPNRSDVRMRLRALEGLDDIDGLDAATVLRLRFLHDHTVTLRDLDEKDRRAASELGELVVARGSSLDQLCGLATRSTAELLVEVGDPRRFASEGGFARFNGTAPLPTSSGEGHGEPKRYRFNDGGNRRVNAVLHRMAVTQLRCEPRARAIYDNARKRGHTKTEAMRILKRHLSNVVYRRMIRDITSRQTALLT